MKVKVTKKAKSEYVKAKLSTDPKWMYGALMKIYSFQTPMEKAVGTTNEYNDVGFTGTDADILSSFAEQYKRRGSLSEKQFEIVKKKMKKYHRQILDVSDEHKLLKAMAMDGVITKETLFAHLLITE